VAKPKITVVIPELAMGGAAHVVRDQVKMLRPFFDITQVVFNSGDGVDVPTASPVNSLDVERGTTGLRKLLGFSSRILRFRRLKGRIRPDVSISHLEGATYVDILSRIGETNIAVIHSTILYNNELAGLRGWLRKYVLMPAAYKRADVVVPVSAALVPELLSMGISQEKIRVINNFIESKRIVTKSLQALPTEMEEIFQDLPVLAVVARLHHHKNIGRLIDVVSALSFRRRVKLLIIGDGPDRYQLIEHAKSSGLATFDAWSGEAIDAARSIYFVGQQSNPFPYLRHAALYLSSSHIEGFPLAICEALACGLPVVASDCPGGIRDILAPGTLRSTTGVQAAERVPFGVLMPALGEGRSALGIWVNTLVRLLDDAAERRALARDGRRRSNDLSPERIRGEWLGLIHEMLDERRWNGNQPSN